MTGSLDQRVRSILADLGTVDSATCTDGASRALARLDEPLRVAVAGRVKAGKSTLLNALMGEPVAATDAAECTRVITWYRRSMVPGAVALMRDGTERKVLLERSETMASIDLGPIPEDAVERFEVGVPTPWLEGLTLIDTPGIDSVTENVSGRSMAFLAPKPGDQGADVLLFLMRYLHSEDSELLEAFTDPTARTVDPVRSLAVLSRADELGAGRGDGLLVAAEVADRYRRHHHLRQIVSEVFPVSGLMAFFAETISQREYERLAELAQLRGDELERLLASPNRFAADSAGLSSSGSEREALLRRLGLPGTRTSIVAIQDGVTNSATELSLLLRELSGIEPLRRLLLERFASRSHVLKAARALDHAESLTNSLDGRARRSIQRDIDRARINAHELRELDVIRALLQLQEPDVGGIDTDDLLRHLGHHGVTVEARLGSSPGSTQEKRQLAAEHIARLNMAIGAGYLPRDRKEILSATVVSLEVVHHQLENIQDESN